MEVAGLELEEVPPDAEGRHGYLEAPHVPLRATRGGVQRSRPAGPIRGRARARPRRRSRTPPASRSSRTSRCSTGKSGECWPAPGGKRPRKTIDRGRPGLPCRPGFFKTSGMPLLAGRGFEPSDRDGTQPVAILSRRAAEKYFDAIPDAIGRTITISGGDVKDRPVTIVGVTQGTPNTVDWTIIDPQIYVPFGAVAVAIDERAGALGRWRGPRARARASCARRTRRSPSRILRRSRRS